MSSHHHKSKSSAPAWSEWTWQAEHNRYYRYRYNKKGQIIYDYAPAQNVPRTSNAADDGTEALTEQFASTTISSGDANPEEYTYMADGGEAPATTQVDATGHDWKGKGKATEDTTQQDGPYLSSGHGEQYLAGGAIPSDESHVQHDQVPGLQGHGGGDGVEFTYAAATDPAGQSYETQQETDDIQAAIKNSLNPSYPGESSGVQGYGVGQPETYQALQEPDDGYQEAGDVVPPLQPISPSSSRVISGTMGEYEHVDPRYRVVHSNYFQPGSVFKILWADPAGHSKSGKNSREHFTERHSIRDSLGKRFYVGFRRFIIYGTTEGQSFCVPVFTYGNQGCSKPGIKPQNHGIVYAYGSKPKPLPGEPKLGFEPVQMVINADGEYLTKESRVNYSMIYTIQHNVKVFFIGYIAEDDYIRTVCPAVSGIFNQMSTDPSPQKRHSKKGRSPTTK